MKRYILILTSLFLILAFVANTDTCATEKPTREEVENHIRPLFENNEFDEALDYLIDIDSRFPGNSDIQYMIGIAHSGLKNFDKAIEHIENAISIQDTSANYHMMLGNMYFAQAMQGSKLKIFGRMKRGREEFERVLEMNPSDIPARYSLMQYYSQAPGIMGGSQEKADKMFSEMQEVNPEHFLTRAATVQKLVKDKKLDQAETKLNEYVQLSATRRDTTVFAQSYNMLGYAYLNANECDKAVTSFRSYIHLTPGDPNAYDSMGEAFYKCDQPDSATIYFKKALEINPDFNHAKEMLEKLNTKQAN